MNRRIILIFSLCFSALWTFAQPIGKNCEASFTYLQDQGNHLIVNFTNTSTGDITDFFWDFGDGSTFHGEDPSHAFPYTGEFTICLSISNADTLNPCSDSTCTTVRVDILPQYNIGGLLFAGTFPINNPLSTGDTAFAYLYRFEQAGLIAVDSIFFDTLGYFWFMGVTEGKYFLKTGLTESSTRFSGYLPAYHGDCLLWTDADTLIVNQNVYNVNIYMVKGKPMTPGAGMIHGNLLIEQSNGGTIPMEKGQVILADASGIPYQCTYSNPSGEFTFGQIPQGEYQIFGEYTARFSQKIDLLLDETSPNADSLELKLYASISGIDDPHSNQPANVTVFPNPVGSLLKLQIKLNEPEQVKVNIYNHMGQHLVTDEWKFPSGNFQQEIDVSYLPPAIYLITIQNSHSHWQVIKKFVKK
ncbi:MAG: T9SS type A sorting domain-containing protein [Bacteroidales bacterium]|nr:T9SS type A sorting domain-containing protein [Bacteroidales bacterium]